MAILRNNGCANHLVSPQPVIKKRLMANHEPPSSPEPDRASRLNDGHELEFRPKIVHFSEISRCGEEVWIEYQGKLYRLQTTRQGKLVLTK